MPMLKWMGDEEARRATKNGAMKILREDRALSYGTGDNLLVHGDNLEKAVAVTRTLRAEPISLAETRRS